MEFYFWVLTYEMLVGQLTQLHAVPKIFGSSISFYILAFKSNTYSALLLMIRL